MPVTLKSRREIDRMRAAGSIVAEVLDRMRQLVAPGVTTGELEREAARLIQRRGGAPSFLGYGGFPGAICASVNDEVVHGIPGRRRLREGDIISIDVGVIVGGYHADAALTLPVGAVSPRAQRVIAVAEDAFRAGLAQARVGGRIGDISAAVGAVITGAGFQPVEGLSGHGVGRTLHEEPDVPNVGRSGTGMRLRSGLTIAIEPMLSAGSGETSLDADGWTVRTADGSLSAHYEHTVALSEDGPVMLTDVWLDMV